MKKQQTNEGSVKQSSTLQIVERVNVNVLNSWDGSIVTIYDLPIFENEDIEISLHVFTDILSNEYNVNPNHHTYQVFDEEPINITCSVKDLNIEDKMANEILSY